MDSIIELYVNGPSSGTTQGRINLFGDEPISISYSITDIKDISKRKSTVSQNFSIPADKNNNILLGHIFNIGSDSTFDPSKKTPAYLLVNSQMVFNGSLQLLNVKVKNRIPVSYDVVVYGESADLVKELSDKLITDLSFIDLNHNKTVDNIMNSWTANTANLGYYYPLEDRGFDLSLQELNNGIISGNTSYSAYSSTGNGLNPEIFQPAISVKYLWDKIFNRSGFSYESDFLNSSAFTETILPFNQGKTSLLGEDYLDSISFRAFLSADQSPASTGAYITPFNNDSTLGGFDNGFIYSASTYRYISDSTTSQKFAVDILSDYAPGSVVNPLISYSYVDVYFMRSTLTGSTIAFPGGKCFYHAYQTRPNTLTQYRNTVVSPPLNNTSSSPSNYLYPLCPGEQIWCYVTVSSYIGPWGTQQARLLKSGTSFYNLPQPDVFMNGPVNFNQFVPKKIKQIDFVKSIITMFQLMVIPSKDNPRKMLIIPRTEYFANSQVKDWSSKLDVTQPIEELIISEQQAKQIIFTYTPDKDYYNTIYTEDTKKVYGENTTTINNEWLDSNSKQEIKVIFSPTPMDSIIDCDEIILPRYGKLESNGTFGKADFNVRILRKNPTLMPLSSGYTITMLGKAPQNSYPYAGHLDHPFYSTIDYNFGTIDYAYYNTPGFNNLQAITPNNLVNLYWKDYLDYISNKNSKIIKCRMKFSAADIAQFNYNDKIYIEGLTDDGGHYFNVNKITYIPTSDESSVVELIKI